MSSLSVKSKVHEPEVRQSLSIFLLKKENTYHKCRSVPEIQLSFGILGHQFSVPHATFLPSLSQVATILANTTFHCAKPNFFFISAVVAAREGVCCSESNKESPSSFEKLELTEMAELQAGKFPRMTTHGQTQ